MEAEPARIVYCQGSATVWSAISPLPRMTTACEGDLAHDEHDALLIKRVHRVCYHHRNGEDEEEARSKDLILSLTDGDATIADRIGCCHDTPESVHACSVCRHQLFGTCVVCSQPIEERYLEPFLETTLCPTIEAERIALGECSVASRAALRDALTWFQWRVQHAKESAMSTFFQTRYPNVARAMDNVTQMYREHQTGSSAAVWRETMFAANSETRPRYCNWSYAEIGADGRIGRCFYLQIVLPTDEQFMEYLLTVLNPPRPVVTACTPRETRRRDVVGETRLQRRLSHLRSRSMSSDIESDAEDDVVRDERAERFLKKPSQSWIRPYVDGVLPRLIFVALDADFPMHLEPRTDYHFTPHIHYANIMYIKILAQSTGDDDGNDERW